MYDSTVRRQFKVGDNLGSFYRQCEGHLIRNNRYQQGNTLANFANFIKNCDSDNVCRIVTCVFSYKVLESNLHLF